MIAVLIAVGCTPGTVQLTPDGTTVFPSTGDTATTPPTFGGVEVVDHAAGVGLQGFEYGPGDTFQHGRTCIVADLDGDGQQDLVVGNPADTSGWFRNISTPGSIAFEPLRVLADGELWWGASAADYDADGDLDIAVAIGGFEGHGADLLLRNDPADGMPVFTDVAAALGTTAAQDEYGALFENASLSATWGDFDGDADLDLWIDGYADPPAAVDSRLARRALPLLGRNTLWRQDAGAFINRTEVSGLDHQAPTHWSHWFDFDNDGNLDLLEPTYKWVDGTNHLWEQVEPAQFIDRAPTAMLDGGDFRYPAETFSSAVKDVNNDGWLDVMLFVRGQPLEGPHLQGHTLLINVGGTGFVEAAVQAGLNAPFDPGFRDHEVDGVMGSTLEDVNLDGIPDVYIGNGGPSTGWPDQFYLSTGMQTWDHPDVGPIEIPVYVNATDLIDFESEVVAGAPKYPPYPYRTHAICVADLDGDKVMEMFVTNGGLLNWGGDGSAEPDRLFSLQVTPQPRTLTVFLRGDGVTVDLNALHSRIVVTVEEDGEVRTVHDHVVTRNGFGAQHGYERLIGLGQADRIVKVDVIWPRGEVTTVEGVDFEQRLEISP